jgi:serine/threonine protein kinase/tetratricopeptide (TPR) repeat protein
MNTIAPSQNALADNEQVIQLAEDFVDRYRRGEHPSLTEYQQRYPQLASEVESLIDALLVMEKLGSKRTKSPLQLDVPIPEQLGEYQLLRVIGRGGMGVVYEAVQSSLNRQVAVKVLPSQAVAHPKMKDRFLREARTAAGLHHSNIVPVHGVGEQQGICYFVMQLISGMSCDRILHHLHHSKLPHSTINAQADISTQFSEPVTQPAADVPNDASSIPLQRWMSFTYAERCRETARIGQAIAEALAYAHEQGVLHRDIKPGNILIDDNQHPWLNDFGLARPLEKSDLTATGQVVGTLRYLPPERFSGESGVAGDIYALGLTLYELITMEHPYTSSDQAQLVKQIQFDTPASLIEKQPATPADLNTIIMKCLAKHPQERYSTATDLAYDLRAWQAGEPILAKPLRWWEKAHRWMRRNPVVAGLLALVFLTLLAGLSVSTAFWWKAEHDRQDAVVARQNEERSAKQAREAAIQAQNEAKKATTARNESEALNKFFREQILQSPRPDEKGKDITLVQALERAEGSIAEYFGNVPHVELIVRSWMGETYRRLGKYNQAANQLQQSQALLTKLNQTRSITYIRNLANIANVLSEQGKNEEAAKMYQQFFEASKDFDELDEESRKIARQNYAVILQKLKRSDESEKLTKELVEENKETLGPDHKTTLTAQVNLAYSYLTQGKLKQARELCEDAIKKLEASNESRHPISLTAQHNLIKIKFFEKKYAEAEQDAQLLLPVFQEVLGEDNDKTFMLMNDLGVILGTQNKKKEALDVQLKAAQLLEAKTSIENPETLVAWANVGINQYSLQQFDEACKTLERVVNKRKELNIKHDIYTMNGLLFYCQSLVATQKAEQAQKVCQFYLELVGKQSSLANKNTVSMVHRLLGQCYLQQKQYPQAEEWLMKAWQWQKELKGNPPEKVKTLDQLTKLCQATNQKEKLAEWQELAKKMGSSKDKP